MGFESGTGTANPRGPILNICAGARLAALYIGGVASVSFCPRGGLGETIWLGCVGLFEFDSELVLGRRPVTAAAERNGACDVKRGVRNRERSERLTRLGIAGDFGMLEEVVGL